MAGFIIWAAVGCVLVLLGILCFFARKAVGFWANVETLPMRDVKAYNYAVGRLLIGYGILFGLLGLPLALGDGSLWILVPILGVPVETIAAMAIYIIAIQAKYEMK